MRVHDDDGREIDATFRLEKVDDNLSLVFESKGGKRNTTASRNSDYNQGLTLLLERLAQHGATLKDAAIETQATRELPLDSRRLRLDNQSFPVDLASHGDLVGYRVALSRAQAQVGRSPSAKGGGNPTKRIRLYLDLPNCPPIAELGRLLANLPQGE